MGPQMAVDKTTCHSKGRARIALVAGFGLRHSVRLCLQHRVGLIGVVRVSEAQGARAFCALQMTGRAHQVCLPHSQGQHCLEMTLQHLQSSHSAQWSMVQDEHEQFHIVHGSK